MKHTIPYRILTLLIVFVLVACSVKKDKLVNRKYHALTTEYNILYHGDIELTKGLLELNTSVNDNFWSLLPIEKTIDKPEKSETDTPKETPFRLAQDKATKAIQKHSMDIGQKERNPQMDEAYLLLGKARYYDGNFIPALEALNYILYKYPSSSEIINAKIWREKVNIKLDNNEAAIINLKKVLERNNIKDLDRANANLYLAQAYANLEQKDSALIAIKQAIPLVKNKAEKARYTFIKGQLYEQLFFIDSAYTSFQEVIDLKRNAPLELNTQAYAKQAAQFDYQKGDTLVFLKNLNMLIENREYRPHLDVLYHQKGIFYDKQNQFSKALENYASSLKNKKTDEYLIASNYRNSAEIYFRTQRYEKASFYFDSTLVHLNERTREHRYISKRRASLDDVIKYEKIAVEKDSVLALIAMTEVERVAYFTKHITALKELEKLELEKTKADRNKMANAKKSAPSTLNGLDVSPDSDFSNAKAQSLKEFKDTKDVQQKPSSSSGFSQSGFYFYNPVAVSTGKMEFQRNWGKLKIADNWNTENPFANSISDSNTDNNDADDNEKEVSEGENENPAYSLDTYTSKIPTDPLEIEQINKDRNFAYYQLGLLYSDNFKEYQLAINKLEALLNNNPEEKLILPALYNLQKTYNNVSGVKATFYKNKIISEFPDSHYAKLLQNEAVGAVVNEPEVAYDLLYKQLESGNLRELMTQLEQSLMQFAGDEIAPKLALLKANTVARIEGVDGFERELNFVALNYPSKLEGKEASKMIAEIIPALQKLVFSKTDQPSYKIVFPHRKPNAKTELSTKIETYLKNRNNSSLQMSLDVYNSNEDFIVIHGFISEEEAKNALGVLKDYKEYLIIDEAHVINSNDYKVIQIKKNWDEWLKQK